MILKGPCFIARPYERGLVLVPRQFAWVPDVGLAAYVREVLAHPPREVCEETRDGLLGGVSPPVCVVRTCAHCALGKSEVLAGLAAVHYDTHLDTSLLKEDSITS